MSDYRSVPSLFKPFSNDQLLAATNGLTAGNFQRLLTGAIALKDQHSGASIQADVRNVELNAKCSLDRELRSPTGEQVFRGFTDISLKEDDQVQIVDIVQWMVVLDRAGEPAARSRRLPIPAW